VRAKGIATFVSAVLLGCLTAPAAVAAQPSSGVTAFERGVAEFGSSDYGRALADFLEARNDGVDGPQLGYDLAVTYYHLGRYLEASHEFKVLTGISAVAALSHYNLGLIAMRQGDDATAADELHTAYTTATDPTLRTLAEAALSQLESTPAREPRWTAFANAGAGYDSNVALSSESTVITPSHRGSDVYSLLAGAVAQLTGSGADGWQAVGTFYRTDYPVVSQFNQSYLHLGGQYRWGSAAWSQVLGLYAGDLTLGDTNFETLATASAESSFASSSDNTLHAFYRYTRIRGGSDYDYLTGWHQSLGIEDTRKMTSVDLTLGYTFDFNERNNFRAQPQFLSASPTDNGLYAKLNWRVSDIATLIFESDYQHSHYQGADVIFQGATTTNIFREENWWSSEIGATYSLSDRWLLRLDCSFTDNRSNIPEYSYHSNQVMFSIEYVVPN